MFLSAINDALISHKVIVNIAHDYLPTTSIR